MSDKKAPLLRLKSAHVDPKVANDGTWQDAATLPGVRFKVRSINFPDYQTAYTALVKRLSRSHKDNVPSDISIIEEGKILYEHILMDWDGFGGDEVEEPDGKGGTTKALSYLPYDTDTAESVMSNAGYRAIIEAVRNCAIQASMPQLDFVAAAGKN